LARAVQAATRGTWQRSDSAASAGSDGGTRLAADSLAVRFANAVMTRWPDPSSITITPAWEYNHGIVLRGME
jgi:hypothetical protein